MTAPRKLAGVGPLALKNPGSVEYAWQLTDKIKRLYETKELTIQQWEQALEDAERYRIYERVPEEHPYGDLNALLKAEIGRTDEEVRRQILTHQEAGKMGGRGNKALDNVKSFSGNNAEYLESRLERDDPDRYKQLKSGKYKSVRAAALDAGIVRPRMSIPSDVEGAARALARKFTIEELHRLVELLAERIAVDA